MAGDDVDANVVVEYALPGPCAHLPNMADHGGIGTAAAEIHHRAVTSLLGYVFVKDRGRGECSASNSRVPASSVDTGNSSARC